MYRKQRRSRISHIKMTKFQTFISKNVLRIEQAGKLQPSVNIIPLKYVTCIELHNEVPAKIVIQYNTLDQYSRKEMEYSSFGLAQGVFNELQKGLEDIHSSQLK
jgi:hypothetical protein